MLHSWSARTSHNYWIEIRELIKKDEKILKLCYLGTQLSGLCLRMPVRQI